MQRAAMNIEDQIRKVNGGISAALSGIAPEIFDFKAHPFSFLGKAARARFTLLAAQALGADAARAGRAAAAAEMTHTASLLHDDCLDTARYRRGLPTLYDQLGVNGAILVGDLLMALAFDEAGAAAPELQGELAGAVRRMAEGALLEENSRWKKTDAAGAERMTALKTGALFRWCALAACHLARRQDLLETCARLGEGTGVVFQMVDDVLDFEGDSGACGKETLKDIREGKFTLPLILAINDGTAGPKAEKLLETLRAAPAADLGPALELSKLVREGGFCAAARDAASKKAEELKPLADRLPAGEGADALKKFMNDTARRLA
jgi:octaprenyl-diphosphate synthase